ncbi:MAG: restriction endonuclease subunit S [Saprospirales bacterium]|nr:restriction endonuclease subunit S [Saprospirales bacterium]
MYRILSIRNFRTIGRKGEIPVFRMNNLAGGKVILNDLKYIDRSKVPNLSKLLLRKGDILFNRTNSFDLVGKVGIYDSDFEATFASYLIRLKAKTSVVKPEYRNLFLNTKKGQTAIRKYRTLGVSQSNINPENLKKIYVPIVSLENQSGIIQKTEQLFQSLKKSKELGFKALIIQTHLINQIFTP